MVCMPAFYLMLFHNFIRMINRNLFSICLLLFLIPTCIHGQEFGGNPASIKWKQLNNTQTRVIFPAGLDSQANRINNINRLLANTTAWSIGGKQRKWNILLLN